MISRFDRSLLTHLEICRGSLDNRFKKPLALSFQNTPWKTDLKMNFLRNFHLKKNFFCLLVKLGKNASELPSIQKSFFWNGNFSGNSFSNPSFRECFGKTMPRAFWICYLKSLCIFPNELKLYTKIPQISRKMFGSQVQRPLSPISTSERQGKKIWAVPRSTYQVIYKVLSNFHNKKTEKENLP